MEHMIEVPARALADLLDLTSRAAMQLRENEGHCVLADALGGAIQHIRTTVLTPA